MDDRIRVSDADRERVTSRLREHFAEGRLTSEELDERITSALSARTAGDLRQVMTDLPEPAQVPPGGAPPGWGQAGRGQQGWPGWQPGWGGPRGPRFRRRGPRIVPLLLIALIAALALSGGGWVLLAFLKFVLLIWLAACLFGIIAAARFRRRLRHHWQSGEGRPRPRHHEWHD